MIYSSSIIKKGQLCRSEYHNIIFNNIKIIGNSALYYAFYECTGITGSISFPELTSIDNYGLYYAFNGCIGITSISFPKLTTIGNNGLTAAFSGTGITGSVSFPELTNIAGGYVLTNAFRDCTKITELHFRADAQSTVEAASDYINKFGASNATIYFDL